MLLSVSSVISKEHRARGCYMKTMVTPKLLDIVMRTGQAHSQTDAPLRDIVYFMEAT